MGLQAIINALHHKKDIRVDIGYGDLSTELEIWKNRNYVSHFEVYPPMGIIFISEDLSKSLKATEATFRALPRNNYARSLLEVLKDCTNKDHGKTICFHKYYPDTRTLCRFIEKYFSFVD